jgi:hypothetical protein
MYLGWYAEVLLESGLGHTGGVQSCQSNVFRRGCHDAPVRLQSATNHTKGWANEILLLMYPDFPMFTDSLLSFQSRVKYWMALQSRVECRKEYSKVYKGWEIGENGD